MPDIRHRVESAPPQHRVYEMLTTKDGLAKFWTRQHDYDPLRRCRRHRRSGNNLFRLAEQGVSQILGGRVLCKRRHSVLSLSRRCFGAALGHQLCPDARAQRGALHHSPRPLPDMLVLWLYQKAKRFDQPSTRTLRLIRRTKESVEGHVSSALRLRNVARAVGRSPAYLTDMFRRVEGLLLHKYIVQLRLARAV